MKFFNRIKSLLARFKRKPTFAEKFSRDAEFFGSRKKREIKEKPYRRVLISLGCMLGAVLLTLSLLLLGRLWKVRAVEAEDCQQYSATVLCEYTGVKAGDEFLGFDAYAVARRLKEELPLIDRVLVYKTIDGRLKIKVTSEHTNLYYTRHNQNYYIISADTREVLGVFSKPDEAKRVGAIYLGLPEETRVRVGEELTFIDLPYEPDSTADVPDYGIITGTPEDEFAYVFEFEETLMKSQLADRVIGMEAGDRYDLYLVLTGNIRVRIGTMEDLDRKLNRAAEIIAEQEAAGKLSGEFPMLVDASKLSAVTFQASPDVEMPAWAK